jgi:hypothetical protein
MTATPRSAAAGSASSCGIPEPAIYSSPQHNGLTASDLVEAKVVVPAHVSGQISTAGREGANRQIREYAERIWNGQPRPWVMACALDADTCQP